MGTTLFLDSSGLWPVVVIDLNLPKDEFSKEDVIAPITHMHYTVIESLIRKKTVQSALRHFQYNPYYSMKTTHSIIIFVSPARHAAYKKALYRVLPASSLFESVAKESQLFGGSNMTFYKEPVDRRTEFLNCEIETRWDALFLIESLRQDSGQRKPGFYR